MRLAVVGSRGFDDFDLFVKIMNRIRIVNSIDCIVSGGAKGVDSMAKHYADVNDISTSIFLADWDKHGKGAGYIRNKDIWDDSDMYLCIWDGKSRGTKHSIDMNKTNVKKMLIFNYIMNRWVDSDNKEITGK